jgi:hypothetical protein
MKATRYAFEALVASGQTEEREVVSWIRRQATPAQVAQTDSIY